MDATPPPTESRRCRARRRARQVLVAALVGFGVLHLGMIASVERWVRLRDPLFGDKAHRLVERIRTTHPAPAVVVMLGASRTGFGFHGLSMERQLGEALGRPVVAYNFGIPASGPITHLVYLRRLLEAGVKPDLLFVEVLPAMLASHLPGGPLEKNWFFVERLRRTEVDLVARYGYPADKVYREWWESAVNPWYGFRHPLLGRVAPGWLKWSQRYDWSRGTDACGWSAQMREAVTPVEYRNGVQQASLEYQAILKEMHVRGPAAEALRELLAVARAAGVPTRLVLMPEGTEFRAWYPPEVNDRLLMLLNELAAREGVELVDARTWVDDAGFSDSHHLLRKGAEAFTARLTNDVVLPLYRSPLAALP